VRDVAAAAAVSPTTASMVLNGRNASFPEATRQRVWDAARSLGYSPNRLARNLVCQSSELIGAVIEYVENPFFSSLAAYLNRRVAEHKYRAMFEVTELNSSREDRDQAVETLLSWRVAGILHWWNESYGRDARRAVAESPLVYFGSAAPSGKADSAILDDYGGAATAVQHLVGLGHRRIGHLSRRASVRSARTRAWTDVLRQAGLPRRAPIECPNESAEEARKAVRLLMSQVKPPTGIFCHNDVMAFGAFRGLRDMGLRVPQDVSLVGFDDTWAAEYLDPPLTTVTFPYRQIIDSALGFLIERIGGLTIKPRQVVLPGCLVVRGSTGPPPC
jgi:LacI family transcriptional regulator